MTPLEQKLLELNLPTMSRQLETTLSEAAHKNLTVAATLEWLTNMELEVCRLRESTDQRHHVHEDILPSIGFRRIR